MTVAGLECALEHRDGADYLAVAGTDSLADLGRSLCAGWREFGPGRLHRGYLNAALDLYPWATSRVVGPVHLAGHSLGGAVAAILAILLHAEGAQMAGVESYGAPSWCDEAFARAYPLPLTRYRCGSDPALHWPPWATAPGRLVSLPSPNYWSPVRGLFDHRLRSYERGNTWITSRC